MQYARHPEFTIGLVKKFRMGGTGEVNDKENALRVIDHNKFFEMQWSEKLWSGKISYIWLLFIFELTIEVLLSLAGKKCFL